MSKLIFKIEVGEDGKLTFFSDGAPGVAITCLIKGMDSEHPFRVMMYAAVLMHMDEKGLSPSAMLAEIQKGWEYFKMKSN